MLLLLFMFEITFNWICFRGMDTKAATGGLL